MASYAKVQDEAFVTLATNDVYAKGALVLAESLKRHGTMRNLVVMVTPQISQTVKSALLDVFDVVKVVDVLDSEDAAHLSLMERPELGITFTKLHCWTLTEYRKCVFMDADMMVLQNIDDLFEREELSAARDSGWPDIFNSGLFVFRPSVETFNKILKLAEDEGSFDGGDQGLLNAFFSDWSMSDVSRHLPFLYNLHITASYTYLPAFKKFGKDTKVVHFLGKVKPWHHEYEQSTGKVKPSGNLPQFLSEWWSIYFEKCHKYFTKEEMVTGILTPHDINAVSSHPTNKQLCNTKEPEPSSSIVNQDPLQTKWEHKCRWESGNIDYEGEDKFENIQALLDTYL